MPTELGLLTIRFRDTGSLAVPGRQDAFLVVCIEVVVFIWEAERERKGARGNDKIVDEDDIASKGENCDPQRNRLVPPPSFPIKVP